MDTVENLEEAIQHPVHKSDSDEGLDFEFILRKELDEMADVPNGAENEDSNARKFSVSEAAEADDKFPQQVTHTKNANWNTMELGEKRKRLR